MKTVIAFILIALSSTLQLQAQNQEVKNDLDSVFIQKGYQLVLKDSALLIYRDTIIILPTGTKYKVKKSPDTKTNDFYDKLEQKTEKKWLTKQMHDALVVNSQAINDDTVEFEKPEQAYKQYLGWTISKISYRQVDVISGNVEDTLLIKSSGIIKSLNSMKAKTRPGVLQKNTIINIGDALNAELLNDNERIFRTLPYIVNAKIYAQTVDSISHKVELIIVTQDQFSIGLTPEFTSIDKFAMRIFDKNAFGTGSEISYALIYEKDTIPEYGTNAHYSINNIAGTFTNARISYTNTPSIEAFTIEGNKDFITPQTKLGGGIFLSKKSDHWYLASTDTSLFIPYGGAFVDTWVGYSPQVFTTQSRNQIVIAGRYDYEAYFEKPLVEADTNQQFANSELLLAAITFRRINYFKSKLLIGFGRTEDVPIGELISITSGYQFSELTDDPYFGIGIGIARNTPLGIIGAKIDFGGFINYDNRTLNDGAFAAKLTYYTPLQPLGRFSLRSSLKFSYLNGINLPNYRVTNISSGIRGLTGNTYYGQDKLIASIESIAFTPWYFIGFRFALYGFADIGFLGFDDLLLDRNHLYSAIGVGARLRNENLVFRTIQLRFTLYNLGPEGISSTGFEINTSEDQLFNAIEIGKPKLVEFN